MVRWLYTTVAEELGRHRNIFGCPYAPCYFGEMQYGPQGEMTAATPDGRRFGEAVTPSFGGDQGRDREGLTALLHSAVSFDHTLASGGLTVNAALDPTLLATPEGTDKVIDLLLAYFFMGGMQAQFNGVSPAQLRAAQQDPDRHRGLLVRVAGFSGYFIQQIPAIQEQIIRRAENAGYLHDDLLESC